MTFSRAIQNRRVGHFLLWNLRQELERLSATKELKRYSARITIMMEVYIQFSGHYGAIQSNVGSTIRANEIVKQVKFWSHLITIHEKIDKTASNGTRIIKIFQSQRDHYNKTVIHY